MTKGGARKGAGRKHAPPDETMVRLNHTFTREQTDWLHQQQNASEIIRQLVEDEMEKTGFNTREEAEAAGFVRVSDAKRELADTNMRVIDIDQVANGPLYGYHFGIAPIGVNEFGNRVYGEPVCRSVDVYLRQEPNQGNGTGAVAAMFRRRDIENAKANG